MKAKQTLFSSGMAHDVLRIWWSRRALNDLERIHAHVAAHDSGAAKRRVDDALEQAKLLSAFPSLGRPSIRNTRELLIRSNYLMTYRVVNGSVEILQVWHVARRR